jgi:hypothetical protein
MKIIVLGPTKMLNGKGRRSVMKQRVHEGLLLTAMSRRRRPAVALMMREFGARICWARRSATTAAMPSASHGDAAAP